MTLNILKTEWVEIKRLSRTLPKPNKRISKKDLSRREVILLLRFRPKFGTSPFFVMGEFRAKKRLSLQILE